MVSIDEARKQCRIHHHEEDVSLAIYIGAATEWMEKVGVDTQQDPTPLPIKQACLLIVAHYFGNREAVPEFRQTSTLPYGVETLLAPYKEHCV